MENIPRIQIVGRGRLGASLAALLQGAPCMLLPPGGNPKDSVDITFICTPDATIQAVSDSLPPGSVVLHCSGVTPLDALAAHQDRGVFHPLMTFPGVAYAIPDLTDVPVGVDGHGRGEEVARLVATWLGMRPFLLPSNRALYHASAVLAGNGATILIGAASEALRAAGIYGVEAEEILTPLVMQSIRNMRDGGIATLTGPLIRGDHQTMQSHQQALNEHELANVHRLYEALVHMARDLLQEP